MDKDAYYFPHFSNARHDRKVKRLIKELGVEGYGVFFMLLEVLREQLDYRYPIDDIDLLADEFGTSEQKVRVVICNYKLFILDEENNFFSPKFIEFMQPYLKMKDQRKLAGMASAEKRRQRSLNGRETVVEQSKVKESKVKESKVNKNTYGEFGLVKLTETEFKKLHTDFDNADELIKFLDEYIEMKGYKAKSHYLAIKKWVVQAVKEQKLRSDKLDGKGFDIKNKVAQHNFEQREYSDYDQFLSNRKDGD